MHTTLALQRLNLIHHLQVGVDKAIDGLATPLEQLREEVMVSSPTKA